MADEQEPSGELSQDDIDALFDAHASAGEELDDNPSAGGARPSGAPSGVSITVAPDVSSLLGVAGVRVLSGLALQAAEVLTVGIDSVAGQRAVLVDVGVTVTDYAAIEGEYGAIDHVGFEIRVALSSSDAHLIAVLVPQQELASLLSLDLSTEQLADAAFAQGQSDAAATSVRELLDLISLTLFAGPLQGVEATLSDLRFGQVDVTMGVLADVAQGAPALRVELTLARTDGTGLTLLLVLPQPLLDALAERLEPIVVDDDDAAPPRPAPTPLRPRSAPAAPPHPTEEPRGFGLDDDPVGPGGARPAATFGAAGDDVDVHPVRFPPLPDGRSQPPASRSLDLIMDVSMRVTVELGRSTMTVEDVLALGPGSVIELNKLAGEPVDILVNDQLIARGEVVVVDENFGVRVTEIVSPRRRAHAMGE